ncbi:MAG: hypothetical protein KAU36_00165, partial [candidate division Zixibacteria bacterium]|nr:hypothetical protein [candidate division Zixibacteria bacterium]
MKLHLASLILIVLFGLAMGGNALAEDPPDPVDLPYFNPYTNNPPGPPPNYDVIDSAYFQGVPDLPQPLDNNAGGYYIFNDTAEGKWYVTNFLYSRGYSLEQFHGSILATLEQNPAPGVNIWANGFELSDNLHQNDRWGWIKWPDEIAPNLYEIWWDITIDYVQKKDTGDYRDTIGVCVAGCAIDFNIWASGHGDPFGIEQIYLGEDMTPLSDVPGFQDWYVGIYDQYQINNPEEDPNTSIFTPKALPGETYNADGLVTVAKCGEYGERYEGSWAYEAKGVQFATLFCPPNLEPNFVDPPTTVETITLCPGESIIRTIEATDPDPTDILTITQIAGPGSLISTPSVSPVTGTFELYPSYSGEYNVSFEVSDGVGGVDYLDLTFHVTLSTAPTVTLPNDTTIALCGSTEICLPVEIEDDDCDVTSVTTNYGSYAGTMANFDQIDRILALGGTVTQIGGGDPGKVLLTASDFVPPINSLSGVDVTLPNFVFSDLVVDYGSFPNGLEQSNAADYMLGAPTDMTFTTPGPGGPDGGDGDGSVAFSAGYNCILGFSGGVTICHGANADFVVFTNTNGGGTATLEFMMDGTPVHSLSRVIPGGSAASGIGGVTFDLPDGITFNEVSIVCDIGTIEIDAIAVRTDPSSTTNDVCFVADSPGVYELEVTAEDACGNTGYDIMLVTIEMNSPPVANAGSDFGVHQCELSEICWGVAFSDPDDNIVLTELVSGPGTLSGNQICFTPSMAGVYTFVIRVVDECGAEGFDTVVVTVTTNGRPVAADPSPVTQFQCEPTELCHTFTATDPNSDPLTWSLISGPGSVTAAGEYCFTPTATGTFVAKVAVSDPCLAADTATITYTITLNSAPVAVDPPSPAERFQCDPEEICYQF